MNDPIEELKNEIEWALCLKYGYSDKIRSIIDTFAKDNVVTPRATIDKRIEKLRDLLDKKGIDEVEFSQEDIIHAGLSELRKIRGDDK